jgi:hypothetical protein
VIEATSTGGRRSGFFTAEKLAPGNLGLLQQYRPKPDSCTAAKNAYSLRSDDRYGLKDARKATIEPNEIDNTPFRAR